MIFMPPRHGKSMLASEFFPAFYLGRNPERQIIHCTYAQELASGFGRKVRNQMIDTAFSRIFPNATVSSDSTAANRFHTTKGGVYHAVGVGGPLTGRGADLLLIDDPIKGREDADSETMRKKLKDWYQSVAYTRLMPGGAIVLIQTRWHEDDLAGWLLTDHAHENWTVLSLPAVNDEGDALWPDHYPLDRLAVIKQALGSRDWSALYQQRPTPDEGGMIKAAWLEHTRYNVLPQGHKLRIVQSWDTAYKPKQINDPSACTTWLQTTTGDYYLIDSLVIRAEYPAVKRAILSHYKKYKPDAVLIEDKASGQSLIQEFKTTTVPVIAVEPDNDKQTRLNAVSSLFEAGKVWLPYSSDWLIDYESELFSFPLGKHDDQCDSTSQALAWMRARNKEFNITTPTSTNLGAW